MRQMDFLPRCCSDMLLELAATFPRLVRRVPVPISASLFALCVATVSAVSVAAPFAVFDPRSMALGGAGVAEASTAAAGYYNPALFSLFLDDEDKVSHSRWAAPIISAKLSTSFNDLGNFQDQDYDGNLRAAIVNFNSTQSTAAAQQVADAASVLQADLGKIANQPQLFDVMAGFGLGLASDRTGGGFFINARSYGSGEVQVSVADQQLLADYVDGMTAVANPGGGGRAVPELFDPVTGELVDRTGDLSSRAAARAVFLFEAGVPFGSRVRYRGRSWYIGATPKIQTMATFDFDGVVHRQSVSVRKDSTARTGVNADIGVATYWNERIRIGTAIKDVRRREISTELGNRVAVGPSWRMGAAYLGDRMTFTADMDVLPSDPIGVEPPSHLVMGGAEYRITGNVHARAGARVDLRSGPERFTWSFGAGAGVRSFFTDVAYAQSSESRAVAVQFGMRF